MEPYWCYIKFDGPSSSLHTARSSDVRDFNPAHPDDYDKTKAYKVFWQEGTGSFDGCYDGFILCMAASLAELKEKAKKAGLKKMPPNYALLMNPQKSPNKRKAQNSRKLKRKGVGVVEGSGKRRRMEDVLAQVNTQRAKNSKSPSPLESSTTPPVLGDVKTPPPQEEKSVLQQKPSSKSPNKLSTSSPKKSSTASPIKFSTSPPKKFSTSSVLEGTPNKNERHDSPNKRQDSDDSENEDLDATVAVSDTEDQTHSINEDSDDYDVNNLLDGIFRNDDPYEKETNDGGPGSIAGGNSPTSETSSDLYSGDTSQDSTAKLVDENKALRASCKISERERLKLFALVQEKDEYITEIQNNLQLLKEEKKKIIKEKNEEILTLKAEMKKLQDDQKLKSPAVLSSLKQENKTLLQLLGAAGDLLQSGLRRFQAKRSLNFEEMSSFSIDSSPEHQKVETIKTDFRKVNVMERKDAPLDRKERNETPLDRKERNDTSLGNKDKTSEKKKPLSQKKGVKHLKAESPGLPTAEFRAISDKVRKDILGEELMAANPEGKVVIGGGLKVAKSKWDEQIKTQKKNSLFVTKLSQHVYGSKALGVRTVGQPKEAGKKMATPSKVDAIVACLRGKIMAEDPSLDDKAADSAAKKAKDVLSQKMQDEARAARARGDKTEAGFEEQGQDD